MFFKHTETARERTLLRVIESQQRIIDDQANRIMSLSGNPWVPSAYDTREAIRPEAEPRTWTASPEQEPIH